MDLGGKKRTAHVAPGHNGVEVEIGVWSEVVRFDVVEVYGLADAAHLSNVSNVML